LPITIQIPKEMKAEIQRLAAQEGRSDSYIARNILGKGLQGHIDMQYGALLKPTIKDAIHDNIQSYNNRTANIGLQTYYAAEQARILAIHILRFLTDLVNSADDNPIDSPDELPLILKVAQEEAWKHMTNLNRDKTVTPATKEDDREWQL
jgi:predicted DNA-binding protein